MVLVRNTTIINFFGGPGVGKSTYSADLYVKMKKAGYDVELVREVAKPWAITGRQIGPFDQMSILGKQMKQESELIGNVDYIITDSPSFLGAVYMYMNHNQMFMMGMVNRYYRYCRSKNVSFKNFYIKRDVPYNTNGRFEDESQIDTVDKKILTELERHSILVEHRIPDIKDVV